MNRVVCSSIAVVGSLLSGCAHTTQGPSVGVAAPELTHSRIVIYKDMATLDTPGGFYVPANEEWVYTESVEIKAYGPIIIDGILRGQAPEDATVPAPTMRLESVSGIIIRGEIHGFPGAHARSNGQAGGDAGALYLRAPVLITNRPIIAPTGGNGRGGKGGTGGYLEVFAAVSGPYFEDREVHHSPLPMLKGGTGGTGSPGGNGGNAMSGLFREAPWMVKYREYYLLRDREIEAARQSGEIR